MIRIIIALLLFTLNIFMALPVKADKPGVGERNDSIESLATEIDSNEVSTIKNPEYVQQEQVDNSAESTMAQSNEMCDEYQAHEEVVPSDDVPSEGINKSPIQILHDKVNSSVALLSDLKMKESDRVKVDSALNAYSKLTQALSLQLKQTLDQVPVDSDGNPAWYLQLLNSDDSIFEINIIKEQSPPAALCKFYNSVCQVIDLKKNLDIVTETIKKQEAIYRDNGITDEKLLLTKVKDALRDTSFSDRIIAIYDSISEIKPSMQHIFSPSQVEYINGLLNQYDPLIRYIE